MFVHCRPPRLGFWAVTAAFLLLSFLPFTSFAQTIDLRVLVISTGTADQDAGLDLVDDLLEEMGVPYEVLDASTETLTSDFLSEGGHGYFNGIILTDTFLYYSGPGNYLNSALTLEEWQILHAYERDFGVQESVISGYPVSGEYFRINYDLDYGMDLATVEAGSDFTGIWTDPAGGTEVFEYVNTDTALPITDYAVALSPADDAAAPEVTPLLIDQDSGKALVSQLDYADGRRVLLSTVSNADFLLHSQLLSYEFVNFASNGLFIGSRKVYLAAQVDDLFLASAQWDPDTNTTSDENAYRNTAEDITNLVSAKSDFQSNYPLFGDFTLDMAFNGFGAAEGDALTEAVIANQDSFRFLNHTYTHYSLYTSNGATYDVSRAEIEDNLDVWQTLGFPDFDTASQALITGRHSGLENIDYTDGIDNLIATYPEGLNTDLIQAALDSGIKYLASDSSRVNQDYEHYVEVGGVETDILLLPRYPTPVFYNVTTPEAMTDEYNYIFYERHVEAGDDPCTIAGAICSPRSYEQILEVEADTTLRHMLTYRPWPHYFHISNIKDYGSGATLQYDWLEAVADNYNKFMTLPVINLAYYDIGVLSEKKLAAKAANVRGYLDTKTDTVTLTADSNVAARVTGLKGGTIYGGQRIRELNVKPTAKTIGVNRLFNK